jgi:hypothetical protein
MINALAATPVHDTLPHLCKRSLQSLGLALEVCDGVAVLPDARLHGIVHRHRRVDLVPLTCEQQPQLTLFGHWITAGALATRRHSRIKPPLRHLQPLRLQL